MATTIQKRGRRHTAAIRYKGAYACSTFSTRLLAEQWADRIKKEIELCLAVGETFDPDRVKTIPTQAIETFNDELQGCPHDADADAFPNARWTFKRVADEYLTKVSSGKKSLKDQRNRIKQLQQSSLATKLVKDIKPEDVYEYLTGLRHHKTGKALASVSIRNMAFLISSIFEKAGAKRIQGGFGIAGLTNPIRTISLPSPPKATKQRNIDPDILSDFFARVAELQSEYKPWLEVFLLLAVQTGMRRSELIGLRWRALHQTSQGFTVKLDDTKSGYSRTIYLNEVCGKRLVALKTIKPIEPEDIASADAMIFPFSKEYASRKFHDVMTAMGYPEIRLHDLRHTALTSMANAGFSLKELMAQSGHRTAAVASRYLHVDERTIRLKLNKLAV